jgi:hypothetical protein
MMIVLIASKRLFGVDRFIREIKVHIQNYGRFFSP